MGDTLAGFDRLEIEAADFEAYDGGATADEIVDFCVKAGFVETERRLMRHCEGIGSYFEIRFKRDHSV